MDKELYNRLKYLIKKKKSFSEICSDLELEDFEVRLLIKALREDDKFVDIIDGELITYKRPNVNLEPYYIRIPKDHIRLGLIGDTHLASKSDRIETIDKVYYEAEIKGVDRILHCGDFLDGRLSFEEHVDSLRETTYDGQVQYGISKYPTFSGITDVVSGNHDDSWYALTGKEIIKDVAKERPDINYLGANSRIIYINGLKISLMHGDIVPYHSKYFKLSRHLSLFNQNERPHIVHTGHLHLSNYTKNGSTEWFRTSSLMNRTRIQRERGLENENSVYWLDVYFDDNGNPARILHKKQTFTK